MLHVITITNNVYYTRTSVRVKKTFLVNGLPTVNNSVAKSVNRMRLIFPRTWHTGEVPFLCIPICICICKTQTRKT